MLLTFENESVKAMAVILLDTRLIWRAVSSSVTRLTKSVPDISSPSLPREPSVTSVIIVEILARA